jgi:Bacterial TSP3 repeat
VTHPRVALAAALGVLVGAGLACTDTYLYDQRRENQVPADRSVALKGEFCTPSTNEVLRPIKIVIAIDASQSMNVNDPNGTRATAVVELLQTLPRDPEIEFAVMLFAGSLPVWLTKTGQPLFDQPFSKDPALAYTDADTLRLVQQLLQFTPAGTMPNRDATDFVKPLSDIYAMISRDISVARTSGTGQARARYSVIFLSDGAPTNNQDDELLCGDAVRRIAQLKDLADDVRVNTVHVALGDQPVPTVCDIDAGSVTQVGNAGCDNAIPEVPPGSCPLLLINYNALRLERMSTLGGGDFRDFRNNEPINFLNFRFGQTRRSFELAKVVASNFSAPGGSPLERADTDGDFLLDTEEAVAGTDPFERDTDGDGFSDGVEVYFGTRGASFNPLNVSDADGGGLDPGCPPSLRGVDGDCDGLTDCDEQIIGTNSTLMDSDDDGVVDSIEWQLKTQPAAKDLAIDTDSDNVSNGDELQMHMDPLSIDTAKLATNAYRYKVEENGRIDDQGRQCFRFRVDNVLLANTLPDTRDAGNPDGGAPLYRRGAGYNDIFFTVAMKPGDDPSARTLVRSVRFRSPRFPVGGIRSPIDGELQVSDTDLVDRCGPAAAAP